MMFPKRIVFLFVMVIQRVAFDLTDVLLESVIPSLIEELRALSETQKDEGRRDSRDSSESGERCHSCSSTRSDTGWTRIAEGLTITTKTRGSVSPANTAPIIFHGRACQCGRKTIAAQTSRTVAAANTTDINLKGTDTAYIVFTIVTC